MALIKSAVKLIVREHASYVFKGPVLMLGVPEIYATYLEVKQCFSTLCQTSCQLKPDDVVISTNVIGSRLGWVSSPSFLKAFGFSEVTSVDIPGCEHAPDLIHDLNQPFSPEFKNRFNLILDPGTVEHVFDMKTCFSNLVSALKVGGVMIHFNPIYSYNGGYFSINPNVLIDFYTANGFDQIKAFIIMWDRYRPYSGTCKCYRYTERVLAERHALADYDQCRFCPHLLLFARKAADSGVILNPIQSYSFHSTPRIISSSISREGVPVVGRNILARVYKQGCSMGWKHWLRCQARRFITSLKRRVPFEVLCFWGAYSQRKKQLRRSHCVSFRI